MAPTRLFKTQKNVFARMVEVVLKIAHFTQKLKRNISGDDSWHISLAAFELVVKKIVPFVIFM